MSKVITLAELATSAATYRKELLKMPVQALAPLLKYFTLRTGIRYSETVGELSGDLQIGPYNEDRVDNEDITVTPRTLKTYHGNVVKEFSPNSVASTIYGANITKGDALQNVDISVQVLGFLAGKIGKSLAMHVFDAVRKDSGTKTADLFDGLDTITKKEITSGNIAVSKGNLFEFTEAITSDNAVDLLRAYCRAAKDELLGFEDGGEEAGGELNLLVPRSVLYAYCDDYKTTTGHSPIYDKFNQAVIEGFNNIHIVPIAGKAASDYIQLSTKGNLLMGVNQQGDEESIIVEKHHPYKIQFIADMFFGVDYESVSPERLLVGKLFKSAAQA